MADNNISLQTQNNEQIITSSTSNDDGSKLQIEGFNSFEEYIKSGFQSAMAVAVGSNKIPKGDQWEYYKTFPSFKGIIDNEASKIVHLMSLILQHQGCQQNIARRDVEEKYDMIVEANDTIMERVGINLDELSGIRRNPIAPSVNNAYFSPKPVSGSWNKNVAESSAWKEVKTGAPSQSSFRLVHSKMTQRPQIKFKDKIDNRPIPFEPRIKEKPNALKPLAILVEQCENGEICYSHPYEYELDRFADKISKLDLQEVEPCPYKPIGDTPMLYVDKEHLLEQMLGELKNFKEIAVDLEHHSYRTFQGFTCLMQISTREKDYIIDALELRDNLYVLNEIFTDPKVVKVFHGAESDIQWLQRDLCLYVVNMFDTYQAALQLSLPRLSLAYLLKTYCDVNADKYYQLYDWRTRPLSAEALSYAQEDTHYLLYIYDMLKNRLIKEGNGGTHRLESVIFQSTEVCKKRYWKSILKEDGHLEFCRKMKKSFDNRQMYALKELYQWRDKIAREEDESLNYVLPNHMLIQIAETLPREMQGILACCTPIPPLVRQHLVTLHQMVLKARDQPLVARPAINEHALHIQTVQQCLVNLDNPLHCPHDLTQDHDFRSDLPTLLNGHDLNVEVDESIQADKPRTSIFNSMEEKEDLNASQIDNLQHVTFMSPYERYKKVLVYLNESREEEESNEKKQEEDEEARREKLVRELNFINEKQREVEASGIIKPERSDLLDDSVVILDTDNIKTEDSEHAKKRDRSQESISTDASEITGSVVKLEPHEDSPMKRKRPKKKKKTENINEDDNSNKTKEFKPFDYSQIDYTSFQSGQKHKPNRDPQESFKGKGKKNKKFAGKSNNKSFTFSKAGKW